MKQTVVEPRVFWIGLSNGEVADILLDRYEIPSPIDLEEKANILGIHLEKNHLENGYVVSRKENFDPDETGDATTYMGFYVTSLAWKYERMQDPETYKQLVRGIQTLAKKHCRNRR